jgi:hypothetical protein
MNARLKSIVKNSFASATRKTLCFEYQLFGIYHPPPPPPPPPPPTTTTTTTTTTTD